MRLISRVCAKCPVAKPAGSRKKGVGASVLVLSRMRGERVVVTVPPSQKPVKVVVELVEPRGDRARIGFAAPVGVSIHRKEVQDRVDHENSKKSGPAC